MTVDRSAEQTWAAEKRPFLVLTENHLAYTAATGLHGRRPVRSAALLTIHGPPGVGKSHLCDHVLRTGGQANGSRAGVHVTCAEFAAEWEEAARNRLFRQFHERYEACGLLVCEDLQGLRGRGRVQQALVAVIDHLTAYNGRLLLTSSRPVSDLPGLSRRLVDRCHGGITAPIDLPSEDSRVKLLRHFAKLLQVPVSMDALQFLAVQQDVSPRELLGFMTRLSQHAEQKRQTIDLNVVRTFINEEPDAATRSVSEVAREVARQFGVTLRVLRSESRAAKALVPRQAAMYLSRELTAAACGNIGDYFNGRSHSTVVHACQRFQHRLDSDPSLPSLVHNIRKSLSDRRSKSTRRKDVNRRRSRRASAG